jgi:glycosyltransferase involved in cell wall biosynthesis
VRILQVVTDTDRRGAQTFAVDLGDALTALGNQVRTVALARGLTVDATPLDVPVLGRTRRGVATLRALRRELAHVDVVIAHGSTTLPMCAIATLGTGVPFVYRQISDSQFWAPPGIRRARVRAGLRRATRVVALWKGSAATLESEFGVRAERVRVIPNAVRAERFRPAQQGQREQCRVAFGLDPARPTVVYLGALVPEKGVDLLIDAAACTQAVQVLVVGDGPARTDLEARARRVAFGRVAFAGVVGDAADAYAAADAVVLPSRGGDSMPAVLIEAALMGVPAIATPIEAIPEIVIAGVTGLLVPVDSVSALADALRRLVADDALRARLGDAARAHCSARFTLDSVGAQWEATLVEIT